MSIKRNAGIKNYVYQLSLVVNCQTPDVKMKQQELHTSVGKAVIISFFLSKILPQVVVFLNDFRLR